MQTMPVGGPSTSELKEQIAQNELLFTKIRSELQTQLSENLKKINTEISDIRSKQSLMSTMDSRKTEEQKMLAESIQKPAQMLEEMKSKWETIMRDQQNTMRELVNQTVMSALQKEEERKGQPAATTEEIGASAAEKKFFLEKIEQFEAQFEDNQREIESLKSQKRKVAESEAQKVREL